LIGTERGGHEELFVDSGDGTSIFVEATGRPDAPAILILDGIGCSGWAFRRIVPQLAADHRVALLHYRGHGRSPNPARPWQLGMHDLADDAAAVLSGLGVDKALVVGFSMGFQVGLELYKRHRECVGGLVSLAGPSGRALAQFQGTDIFGRVLPLVRAATRHASDFTLRLWQRLLPSKVLQIVGLHTQLNAARIELADLQFYLSQMAAMSPELFMEMLQEATRHCSDDVLAQVRVPTLVVAGAHDRFVPMETMRSIAFAIPGAQWVVIPGASHALPAEFSDEITTQLRRFSKTVFGER
jgi:pimeloyl-ACP methyl ester carboxylesterase